MRLTRPEQNLSAKLALAALLALVAACGQFVPVIPVEETDDEVTPAPDAAIDATVADSLKTDGSAAEISDADATTDGQTALDDADAAADADTDLAAELANVGDGEVVEDVADGVATIDCCSELQPDALPDGDTQPDGAGDALDAVKDPGGSDGDVPDISDIPKEIVQDFIVAKPDALADAADVTPAAFEPSWKDLNGCENYEFFKDGQCQSQNPEQKKVEKSCWVSGQVNELGVGKPCQPGVVSCAGLAASCCMVDNKKFGAICTMPCKIGQPNDGCGANSWCHSVPAMNGATPLSMCMPSICMELFTSFYPAVGKKTMGFLCPEGKVNADGVGLKCTLAGNECKKANLDPDLYCLGQTLYYPSPFSSFCTHPCSSDVDCGAKSQCIFSNGKPYFCAPTSCAGQFEGLLFMNFAEDDSAEWKACLAK